MEQVNCTTRRRGYKHLTECERYKIEGWLEARLPFDEIAKRLNKHRATVYREIKRGTVTKLINKWKIVLDYRVGNYINQNNQKVTGVIEANYDKYYYAVDPLGYGYRLERSEHAPQ